MEASGQGAQAADLQSLLRRRERLAGEVAELHWDLGGLAYEMAIRDYFRPDVLVGRAALLQERDAELAEVERKLAAQGATLAAGPAAAGGGALAIGEQPTAQFPAAAAEPAKARRRFGSLGIWGLLVLACLGFGAMLGDASHSTATGRLEAARPPLRLVLPAGGGSARLPAAEATPTPAADEVESEPASEGATESPAASAGGGTRSGHAGSAKRSAGSAAGGAGRQGSSGGSGVGSTGGGGAGGEGAAKKPKLPPVRHVFLVVLDDEPYATVFGPSSPASYLTHTLEHKGELLVRYYAVAHEQLANEIALISGQGPTVQTAENCPTYSAIVPTGAGADDQVLGNGCVYPTSTQTLPGQLAAKHLTWRAYVEGMDEGGGSAACEHPALDQVDTSSFDPGVATGSSPGAGAAPGASGAAAVDPGGSPYATFRNPFVYFQSLAGAPACAVDDVGIDRLKGDLADAARTPSVSYVVPDLCDDGSPTPCAPGRAAGMVPADGFLKRVVPQILASPAYRHGGLLAITVDEAPSTGEYADSSSCCAQPQFPNLPAPTGTAAALSPSGGGEVGALLLSPYVKAGTTSQEEFNHYSLLRTIENLFGLAHLGYAALPKLEAFGASVFNAGETG
jgi:phosphatidylinositol-3-phosphatase